MQKEVISVPAMYGDHHVLEVRRILLALPGIDDVNASSCFQVVEVSYDAAKINIDEITKKLAEVGYLEKLQTPVETGVAVTQEARRNGDTFFRHTTAYEQTKNVVGFAQKVNYTGRSLWPCPGMGVIGEEKVNVESITEGVNNG